MTESDIYWTFATAYQHGGSFMQALAQAGMRADQQNKQRILKAFPELNAQYGTNSNLHQQLRSGATIR